MGMHEKRIDLDTMTNIKYYLLDKSDNNVPFGYEKVMEKDNKVLYENTNFVEFGFAFDTIISDSQLYSSDTFDNSRYLTSYKARTVNNETNYSRYAILDEEIAQVLKTGSNDFYCIDGEIRNYDNAFTTCLMPSHYLEEIDKLPVYLNSNNHQLTKSEVCFIQDVYYTLSEEYRNKIAYFDYSDEYRYSYFFNLTNDTLYEVVVEFNSSLKESENIAFALDSTAQENYYKDFLDNPNTLTLTFELFISG